MNLKFNILFSISVFRGKARIAEGDTKSWFVAASGNPELNEHTVDLFGESEVQDTFEYFCFGDTADISGWLQKMMVCVCFLRPGTLR